MCHADHVSLPCTGASVRTARRWVSNRIRQLYGHPAVPAEDAEVVVSELVTNCLRADAHEFTVSIEAHHRRLRIAATDDALGVPQPHQAAPTDDHGRGLTIVAGLSQSWGVEPGPVSKTVWADIAVPDGNHPAFDCTERQAERP